jgi:hypothetical protein
MPNRDELDRRWKANEAELNRLNSLSPLNRESFSGRIEQLGADRGQIEYDLGQQDTPSGSRKWSGVP